MSSKVCVIIGAGPGIGMAVARRFAKEGYRIALLSRQPEKLELAIVDLQNQGADAHTFEVNAANDHQVRRVFDRIEVQMGEPDVLVYNAFAMQYTQPSMLNPEKVIQDFKVNVTGALVSAQCVIPHMQEHNDGTIIFTGGGLALSPRPEYASLSLSKAALRSLAFSLAMEVEADNIHVATVTIAGFVKPGTHFDPDLIAEKYWLLHTQEKGAWDTEIIYK